MRISLIVAMSENQVIGRDNQLPWHLPNDLKHFKSLTLGKTIVMGRKTYESIGKALPGRKNVVMSTNLNFQAPGCHVVHTKQAVLDLEKSDGSAEVMIIGGTKVFEEFATMATTLYLTQVHAQIDGDSFFPECSKLTINWVETDRQRFESDAQHAYAYSFIILQAPHQIK